MSWNSRAFTRASALALCSALLGLFSSVASAATISYGDFNAPPAMFLDVEESSVGSPLPLYGPPAPFSGGFQAGLDFDPKNFVALSAGGGPIDITDGQLNFTVMSPGLQSLDLLEAGDYTLAGVGGAATFVNAAATIRATVTQINGVNVAPILLTPVVASVTHSLPGNAGFLQPWSLGATIDVAGQLGAGQNATKVDIVIDNALTAGSEPTSAAFIAKKEFIITTEIIPEPATFAMGALALCGMAVGMRRRS
jgi:hypothetical protein